MSPGDLRAWWWLTLTGVRRLMRQSLVVRSLVWPPLLAIGTLLLTLGVAASLTLSNEVAVSPDIPEDLRMQIIEEGWSTVEFADPDAAVRDWSTSFGTDGHTLWATGRWRSTARLESVLRSYRGSGWIEVPVYSAPTTAESSVQGQWFFQALTLLYALYGVVFGIALIARDRDEGTLEVELSLPVSFWVHGASRWMSAVIVIALFQSYCVLLTDALIGVADQGALMRHGVAATMSAVSLGVIVVGTAGIQRGFSGPFAFGLTIATGLFGLGFSAPQIGQYFPMASALTHGDGWAPLTLGVLSGILAALVFARRTARA